MSDLTAKFDALTTDINDNQTAMMGALSSIADTLSLLNTALDTLNDNQATNTKYLLGAIGQNSPCAPCPTPSLTVPPVDATGRPISDDACKRAQAFLHTLESILETFDNLMALNVSGAWTLISDAISQVIATIGGGDSPPLPSFPEAVNIAGDYFSFAAGHLFSGETAVGDLSPLLFGLRDAIYFSGSSAVAQSQYNAIIDASWMSNEGKLLLKATAYSALWSYYLDTSSSPDLTPYDGTICSGSLHSITACQTFAATQENPGGFYIWELRLPEHWVMNGDFIAGDYFGWTFRLVSGTAGKAIKVEQDIAGSGTSLAFSMIPGDTAHTITNHTDAIRISTVDNGVGNAFPFSMEICPP